MTDEDKNEPGPLSETYHKARRNLALFSGALIAWEYVGIRFGQEGRLSILGADVRIQHQQVIPVVIVALVLYYAFRLAIEWMQCDANRRALAVAKIDLYVAYALGVVGVAVFSLQRISPFQLAEALTAITIAWLGAGVGLAAIVHTGASGFARRRETSEASRLTYLILVLVFLVLWLVAAIVVGLTVGVGAAIGFFSGYFSLGALLTSLELTLSKTAPAQ